MSGDKYEKATTPVAFEFDGDFFDTCKLKESRALGAGMTGEVVLATSLNDPSVSRAVKKFSLLGSNGIRSRRLFAKEVEIMHQLDHSNIVKFLLAAKCPEYLVICMEYHPNGTLESKLGNLCLDDVELYLVQVACATKYLHTKRIVHCDIKLPNILLGSDKKAVLCDFGLAMEVPADTKTVNFGLCGGTPSYMAPELEGLYPLDFQVDPFKLDSYSLGVVLWAMALETKPSYIYDYMEELRTAPEPMAGACRKWLEMLLERNPTKRATVEALLDDLRGHSVWGVLVDELE